MKLIVFGANGRTGRQVVQQALQAGHDVTAYVRRDKHLFPDHENLQFVLGDARDKDAVAAAIEGQQTVISIISPQLGDKSNYDISEVAMRYIILGMQQHGVQRLIIQSGAWGTEHFEDAHPLGRLVFQKILGQIYEYKKHEDELVKNSGLQWTIVRCALLTPFGLKPRLHVDMERHRTKLWEVPLVSRKSVAHFMLDIIDDPSYFQRCPIIMN